MRFALVLVLSTFAFCATSANAMDRRTPYRDFEKVCLSIFAKRASEAGDQSNSAGNQICQCTSQESKHQGVTVPELKKETAQIRKDPKYQIRNPKLLAAFQWCVIVAMDQKSHEMDSNPSDSK